MATTDQSFINAFQEIATSEKVETINTRYIDPVQEAETIASLEQEVQDLLDSITELDSETDIYNLAISSVVKGINDYLESKLAELKADDADAGRFLVYGLTNGGFLGGGGGLGGGGFFVPGTAVPPSYVPDYDPEAPDVEVRDGRVLIPYQIHYSYLNSDPTSGRSPGIDPDINPDGSPTNQAPADPTIRGAALYTVNTDGYTRSYPGNRLPTSDPLYEFFEIGIEIYYYQPYSRLVGTTYVLDHIKIEVLNTSNDPELASKVAEAVAIYDLFENSAFGGEEVIGSYAESVQNLSQVQGIRDQIARLQFRNQVLRDMVEG